MAAPPEGAMPDELHADDEFSAVLAQIERGEITQREAIDRLVPLVYSELRSMASRKLRRENNAATLNTTGLVHEAYVKLVGGDALPVKSRTYFFGAASRAMRQVLVDAARRRQRDKRGDGVRPLTLEEGSLPVDTTALEVLALDRALEKLAASHPRPAQVLECRLFGGLSEEETCQALQLSRRSVTRDATFARAWLKRELAG